MLFKSSSEKITAKLKSLQLSGGVISGVVEREGKVYVTVEADNITSEAASLAKKMIEGKLEGHAGVKSVNVIFTGSKPPEPEKKRANWNHDPVEGIKKIIAVASGKGGVGKSTITAQLAAALAASGQKVGIMDADIYGPSMPRMLGLSGKPETENGKIIPLECNGGVLATTSERSESSLRGARAAEPLSANYKIKCMSMGFLVAGDQPVVWRGPMLSKTINQFLRSVEWGKLDFLLVDMPPGTGDIHISMIQQVPLSGVIIVSTPQEVALDDARRCLAMFKQLGVPALGIIENMSWFNDPSGNRNYIFGEGGAEKTARELGVPFLGAVPLEPKVREALDNGKIVVPEELMKIVAVLCKNS